MQAPTLIDYATFVANATPTDARALALLNDGATIKTQDAGEADAYQALGVRLYDAGVVSRFRRGIEAIGGETWHVFDGRVVPQAQVYLADAASAYLAAQQAPPESP